MDTGTRRSAVPGGKTMGAGQVGSVRLPQASQPVKSRHRHGIERGAGNSQAGPRMVTEAV